MWLVVQACVRGTAHEQMETPCQDACGVRELTRGENETVVVVISDGAGSAKHADVGSRVAVEALLGAVESDTVDYATAERELVRKWFATTRAALEQNARELNCNLSDLACTVLLALIWPKGVVLAGLGDGAWIVQTSSDLVVPVWPCKGEYANQCPFITSSDWAEDLAIETINDEVLAVAGFTDGLEALALNYRDRRAHAPFFEALLRLRQATVGSSRDETLAASLQSADVTARTDDDKTLVLVCRESAPKGNEASG